MNLLDWILIAVAVMYGFVGYWQGLIAGIGGVVGLLLGGWLGFTIAPHIVGRSGTPMSQIAFLFVVIACASIAMAVCQFVGGQLRALLHWQPVRQLDNIGGAALSAAAALVVAWALGVAVSVPSQFATARHLVSESKIWTAINDAMPASAVRFVKGLSDLAAKSGLQGDLWSSLWGPEPTIVPTGPVDPAILADPEIRRAEASVFKIRGANGCGSEVEGTGFLVAPGALMTNAHVVAGVNEPTVQIGGRIVQARVVYYNPDVDIAVLHFYGDGGTPLRLVENGAANEKVAVIGYPENGPLNVQAARIREQIRLRSQNIYGKGPVQRDAFTLRGLIRPGNSGGPVVDGEGRVVGVVFAASVTDAATGYALTASQVAPFLKYAGPGPQNGEWPTVSTGDCAG